MEHLRREIGFDRRRDRMGFVGLEPGSKQFLVAHLMPHADQMRARRVRHDRRGVLGEQFVAIGGFADVQGGYGEILHQTGILDREFDADRAAAPIAVDIDLGVARGLDGKRQVARLRFDRDGGAPKLVALGIVGLAVAGQIDRQHRALADERTHVAIHAEGRAGGRMDEHDRAAGRIGVAARVKGGAVDLKVLRPDAAGHGLGRHNRRRGAAGVFAEDLFRLILRRDKIRRADGRDVGGRLGHLRHVGVERIGFRRHDHHVGGHVAHGVGGVEREGRTIGAAIVVAGAEEFHHGPVDAFRRRQIDRHAP